MEPAKTLVEENIKWWDEQVKFPTESNRKLAQKAWMDWQGFKHDIEELNEYRKDKNIAINRALEIIIMLQDDKQLENYDNNRDCWNGALLAAHRRIRCILDPYSLFENVKPALKKEGE